MNPLQRYTHWLHTQWPAGLVEPLPDIDESGRTNLSGVYIVGDLQGIPLLKFSLDSGTRAVQQIARDLKSLPGASRSPQALDLVIVGGGVSGMAAAVEARAQGLNFKILEAAETFATIINFPKGKPIYTYPKDMRPAGRLTVAAEVKEALVEELRRQVKEIETTPLLAERISRQGDTLEVAVKDGLPLTARRVIVAIGRSGNYRKLNVPGETLDKVYNRLHDPKDFAGQKVLVVGGGDSALETALALSQAGAEVTLSYRQKSFSRAKPENIEQVEQATSGLRRLLGSQVREIREKDVRLEADGGPLTLPNDVVFTMIGRDAPLDFFRRSGIAIRNEWTVSRIAACLSFMTFCFFLYSWKSGGFLSRLAYSRHWFPTNLSVLFPSRAPGSLAGILVISAQNPAFWYTLAYSTLVVIFGLKRIRRRKTPYVKLQSFTLMGFQVLPLFLLPEILLPWLGAHHLLPLRLADALFPVVSYGHGREYWRAYGFILAWPLMVYNVFTHKPLVAWLVISGLQTLVFIPILIYFFGKGAYCGWICSCGALAETVGDTQRTKMPHGPGWNRLNMAGQVILAIAIVMLGFRVAGWFMPEGSWVNLAFDRMEHYYKWIIDVGLAGIIGVGVYFWFSGRAWCRFFCPLAALMHIYTRFSRFRIFAEKKKCISCNVCTSVCHQGIDVMSFANKGLPMNDPQCVRCSACVQSCPTDVLRFGQITSTGIWYDRLPASLMQMDNKKDHASVAHPSQS